jgi:hypothetical protein
LELIATGFIEQFRPELKCLSLDKSKGSL